MSQRRADGDPDDLRQETGPYAAFETQDWLIVFEALVAWAGPPADEARGTTQTPRERRAWELVDRIAADLDLPLEELPHQIDDDWDGSTDEC
jgi:hypothetical protein